MNIAIFVMMRIHIEINDESVSFDFIDGYWILHVGYYIFDIGNILL
jgi:hypothetical protein